MWPRGGRAMATRHVESWQRGGDLVAWEAKAFLLLLPCAKRLGANAIVDVRFTTSVMLSGAAELLAYGTAVKIEE